MRTLRMSDDAVSPVVATVLLTAIVLILSASAFVLANSFRDASQSESPPNVAMANADGELRRTSWNLKVITASPPTSIDKYLFIVRTPGNGTLVGAAPSSTMPEALDMYFQLGAGAGQGRHVDNATTVGADGLGGFHLRISDIDGDGRFGAGDRVDLWYDGDGDQAHQNGPDDLFPGGLYEFELKHVPSQSYVALEQRQF